MNPMTDEIREYMQDAIDAMIATRQLITDLRDAEGLSSECYHMLYSLHSGTAEYARGNSGDDLAQYPRFLLIIARNVAALSTTRRRSVCSISPITLRMSLKDYLES